MVGIQLTIFEDRTMSYGRVTVLWADDAVKFRKAIESLGHKLEERAYRDLAIQVDLIVWGDA